MAVTIKLKTLEGQDYRLPRIIYNILKEGNNRVTQKFDFPIVITGSVGSGKSNLLFGIGGTWQNVFLKREFNIGHIHFISDDIIKATERTDNYKDFIGYDEAIQGGTSRDGMTKIGAILRKTLITKRKKGHCIVSCVDSIKELNDKILERCAVWFHVHYYRTKEGRYRRGIVKVFTPQEALKVYEDLKNKKYTKTEEHPIWQRKWKVYTLPNYANLWFPEVEYDTKKDKDTNMLEKSEADNKTLDQRNSAVMFCLELGAKQIEVANKLGLSRSTIADIKQKVSSL